MYECTRCGHTKGALSPAPEYEFRRRITSREETHFEGAFDTCSSCQRFSFFFKFRVDEGTLKKLDEKLPGNNLEDSTKGRMQRDKRERNSMGARYITKPTPIRQNSQAESPARHLENWAIQAVKPPVNFRGFAPPPPSQNEIRRHKNSPLQACPEDDEDRKALMKPQRSPRQLTTDTGLRVDGGIEGEDSTNDISLRNSLKNLLRRHETKGAAALCKQPKRKKMVRQADLSNNHLEPHCAVKSPDGSHRQQNSIWDKYYERIPQRVRIRSNEPLEEQNLDDWMEPARCHCFVPSTDNVSDEERKTGGGNNPKTRGADHFKLGAHVSSHKSHLHRNYLLRKLKKKRKLVKTLTIMHRCVEAEYECTQTRLQELEEQRLLTEMGHAALKRRH